MIWSFREIVIAPDEMIPRIENVDDEDENEDENDENDVDSVVDYRDSVVGHDYCYCYC